MLTEAQIASNRTTAANLIKGQLALADIPASEWTYEQRINYNKTLAQYIKAHPASFSQQDLMTAKDVETQDYSALQDADFSFTEFGSLAVQPLANAAVSVGSGALTVLNATKWVIPLVAGTVLVFWLMGVKKKLA